METTSDRRERVLEWKASGLTATKYCEGKPFTPGALRQWAYQLGLVKKRRPAPPLIRVAKVMPVASVAMPILTHRSPEAEPLVVECGVARIQVRPGFDRETLSAVFDLLGARGGAR